MPEQTMIAGTADVPTARVAAAGEKYVATLAAWQELGKTMIEEQEELIAMMEKDEIEKFILDGHEVMLKTTATTKVKVKKLSQPEEK